MEKEGDIRLGEGQDGECHIHQDPIHSIFSESFAKHDSENIVIVKKNHLEELRKVVPREGEEGSTVGSWRRLARPSLDIVKILDLK